MNPEFPTSRPAERRLWPVGATLRPRNRAELRNADDLALRAWISDSIISWIAANDDGERVSAFAPLVFSPLEPARQFVAWARGLPVDRRAVVELAMSELLESWDPGKDIRATILLVKLAGHLGCRRTTQSLSMLLTKHTAGGLLQVRDLAEAVAFFGRQHATAKEARRLAYDLRDANLSAPTAIAALLARASAEFGASIINDMKILLPEIIEDVAPSDDFIAMQHVRNLKRYFINSLVDILKAPAAWRLSLEAQQRGAPEVREMLEFFRLSPDRVANHQYSLRDKLTRAVSLVDVRDIQPLIISTPASFAVMDKRIAASNVDSHLAMAA